MNIDKIDVLKRASPLVVDKSKKKKKKNKIK